MSITRKSATITIQDQWATKEPDQAAHLSVAQDVNGTDESSYVQGQADQENIYGGFDFSDIPEGSQINSITIRQRSLNLATQNSRSTRFALGVGGVEKVSAIYDVTTNATAIQIAIFLTGEITCADLRAGALDVRKRAFGSAPATDPPVPTVG